MPSISKKLLYPILLLTCAICLLPNCKKFGGDNVGENDKPDLTSMATASSVSGFVTDENNLPVAGAAVKVGTTSTTSNQVGFFEVKNAQLVKNAAFVTVSKTGYFKGIKTFVVTENKGAFFRIKLIKKATAGTFSASAGGSVTLSNGLSVTLPSNAVVNATTKAAYTGSVNMALTYIDPTSAELGKIMPGDLRGIDENGALKLLNSYGMAAVEMTGSAGELLQVASGKKATLKMPVPATLSASAPSSLPLWFFDEDNGLWKQQGSASKSGNNYTGDVSHFSFWNCDVAAGYVPFSATFVDASGHPLEGLYVRIVLVNSPNIYCTGYSDAAGFVSGYLPPQTQVKMEVYTQCPGQAYTQTINTGNSPVPLGNITIQNNTNIVTISGTVLDCSNNPVPNAWLSILHERQFYTTSSNANGTFSFSFIACTPTQNNISIIAQDAATLQQSAPAGYTVSAGTNALGNISACGSPDIQFYRFNINGVQSNYTHPIQPVVQILQFDAAAGLNTDYVQTGSHYSPYLHNSLNFAHDNAAPGSPQLLTRFQVDTIPGIAMPTAIYVNITEYGPIGSFISGNFAGTVVTYNPNRTHTISCTFRVKRAY